ncbi:group III truncated hemoglobin [Hymenobacter wooponensis]|uniref:Group III truncated hemoglobin n=1 Tax=Hymenobacter wooponensis TaxID=1525360 RepID=A0A4Z0MJ31_9BACT|nr:group III truncated hemoglobin [Hymenobacter wooponensis]TGD79763.1 group III truncated hemoglobin [Hymenobacter wooponensis]
MSAEPTALSDIQTEADIKRLVDTFYDKVNADELLSPIFNTVAQVHWEAHLPNMYDFWSSVLLGTTRYRGRPFPKHLGLPVALPHFERWLGLFTSTVRENFAGAKADEACYKAGNIARMFEFRIRQARNPLSIQ